MKWLYKGQHLEPICGAIKAASTGADTEHAITPILQGGEMWFLVSLSNGSDSNVEYEIQRRNALNNGNIKVTRVAVLANSFVQVDVMHNMAENERLRVVNVDAIGVNGSSQAAIVGGWM